jgi:hypothetical protein
MRHLDVKHGPLSHDDKHEGNLLCVHCGGGGAILDTLVDSVKCLLKRRSRSNIVTNSVSIFLLFASSTLTAKHSSGNRLRLVSMPLPLEVELRAAPAY